VSGKSNKNSGVRKGKPKRAGRRRRRGDSSASLSDKLPPVFVAKVTHLSAEGEAMAIPEKWEDTRHVPPTIILSSGKAAAVGDSALVKLSGKGEADALTGHVIKILPKQQSQTVVGVLQKHPKGGVIEPVNRKQKQRYFVSSENLSGAKPEQLVLAQGLAGPAHPSLGFPEAAITEVLGSMDDPRCYSVIAIHHQEIPVDFPPEANEEAERASDPVLNAQRTDLRDVPLVTIDGADARDFDDAVFAEPHGKDGGWHLVVAIADVAHYVMPDSALDREAVNRGNSTYFPDRVVPMLPEVLSNGLCSLRPDGDRYCLVVHLYIDAEGSLTSHRFERGLMRSHARLTYEQCEAREVPKNLQKPVENLYHAYHILLKTRHKRGALDLNLPEFQTQMGEDGHVESVSKRERLDSHKLIEEFMVTANIAAGLTLEKHKLPGLYRVHEAPSADKVEELRSFLKTLSYSLNQAPTAKDMNQLLKKAAGQAEEVLINTTILRSQMQACYLPSNRGHFGLGLTHYAHFTSPIRRYADLVTHRAILAHLEGNTPEKSDDLAGIADHISTTERRSMLAEREANDRYLAAYMASHGQAEFTGTITSVGNYGIFVTLNDTGASGLVRMREIGNDYYVFEEAEHALIGRRSGQRFS